MVVRVRRNHIHLARHEPVRVALDDNLQFSFQYIHDLLVWMMVLCERRARINLDP